MNSSGRFPRSFFAYLFICLFVYLFIGLFVPRVMAQGQDWVGTGYGTNLDDARLNGALNSDSYVTDVTYDNMMAIACGLAPISGESGCTNDATIFQSMLRGSAIGSINNYILAMYTNPPASTYAFLEDTGRTLGFIPKKVEAQGIGFSGLAALLPLWKVFRNVSYGLLAIFMIVIGFMVMLRKKIDPKTVVTVQNALPRIIVTLILITFSYAIVGLLIDIMYFLIFLVIFIIGSARGINSQEISTLQNAYTNSGMSQIFGSLFVSGNQAIPEILSFIFPSIGTRLGIAGAVAGGTGATILSILIGSSLALPATWIPFAITGGVAVVVYLLFVIILFFAFLRIFFMLLVSYINIIISLLASPLQLLLDALPGSSSFSSWLLNLISNIIVFPVTIALLLIGSYLATFNVGGVWAPPLLAPNAQASQGISGILALGMLLSIPTIVGAIKESMKVKPLPVTVGLGQAISSPAATGIQAISTLYYLKSLGGDALWKKIRGAPPEEKR